MQPGFMEHFAALYSSCFLLLSFPSLILLVFVCRGKIMTRLCAHTGLFFVSCLVACLG